MWHYVLWDFTSLLMGLFHLLMSTADWWGFRRDIRHFLLLVSVRCILMTGYQRNLGTVASSSWHRLSQFRHSNPGPIQISETVMHCGCTRAQARVFNQKEVLAAITFNQTKEIPPNGHKSFFDDPNFSHLQGICFHPKLLVFHLQM